MSKRSRKSKAKTPTLTVSKKQDNTGVTIGGDIYNGSTGLEPPKVEVFPADDDEAYIEPVSTFTDPSQYIPIKNIVADNESQQFVDDRVKSDLAEIKETIAELPEASTWLTQRWYGEEFLPEYLRVRAKLRRLAGI